MKRALLYFLWLLLLPIACFSPKSTVAPSVVNLSRMYNPAGTRLHPSFTVYHNSPATSLLLVKIFPVELLYSGTIEPNKLLGQVSMNYVLTDISRIEKPEVADSGQVVYTFARENADKRFITQITLNTEQGKLYQLMITARDMVRNEENLTCLFVDKSSSFSEQNFMLTDVEENVPVFQPYVVGNSLFKLDYANSHNDSIFVRYYGQEIPLPRPSFSLARERDFLENPDSLWVFPFKKSINLQLNYHGIYHFQVDTNHVEGLTLFNFGGSFPRIQEVDQLIEPLAYLSTSVEYEEIQKASNKKLAVDNFWIERTGNIERARELIKVYYNRVFFANFYFTSFKPGWKTDRGMIFIIYGPPQSVKVLPDQEKWIYYKNNFATTVTFNFTFTPSPYALDHYTLQRAENYDTYWRQAVQTWRQGNIFMIE